MSDPRRFRFGLRALLAFVTILALFFGWIAWQHRRVQEQTQLVAELAKINVQVDLEQPTGVGQLVRKFIPQREVWLREQIGRGWFARPAAFVCWRLEDKQVPYVAERLERLGTVREVYIHGQKLSERGAALMRSGLPGVNVARWDDQAGHHYSRALTSQPQFALEGAAIMALFACAIIGALGFIAWRLLRWIAATAMPKRGRTPIPG